VRVLCLGNDLLGDDAFGLVAGRELAKVRPDVEVICSSASGLHLLDYVLDCDRLVVIDTVETGHAEPGTIYVTDELPKSRGDSAHCTGLFDALSLASRLGLNVPSKVTVIAVEAADCRTIGGVMDQRIEAAVDEVVGLVSSFNSSFAL
jgi:hydrogenase maturation protease